MKSILTKAFVLRRVSLFFKPPLRLYSVTRPPPQSPQEEAKAAATQFMQKVDEVKLIDEVLSIETWRSKVMEQTKPIILDCYANWCSPSKKVAKMLEKST